MTGRARTTRRRFVGLLVSAGARAATQIGGKGRNFPAAIFRFRDGATDFPVTRLTDAAHTSFLPPAYSFPIAKKGNFLLYTSDATGRFEAFRMDLRNGQSRQLTEAAGLDPHGVAIDADERGFLFLDENRLVYSNFSRLRERTVYEIAPGFERGKGLGVAGDGQYAAVVEKSGARHRLRLIEIATGEATTIAESEEEIRDPVPRPRRASVLYRRGAEAWLADYDGRQNYRLKLAEGEIGAAMWSPEGRGVLYLNYPPDRHRLHNLREFSTDSNTDEAIADTSQFVAFDRNANASVFVGASGSKASPHVLLLVRSVKRELTLAEHRASDARMVAPVFSPNSTRVYFVSDQHGKPAIYGMTVDKFVEETGNEC